MHNRLATNPTDFSLFKILIDGLTISSVKMISGFIKHIYSLLTYLSAKLFPLANPKFSTLRKRITSGKYFLIISHVLSDELLSMIKISKEILVLFLYYLCMLLFDFDYSM
mgnify:CR=1 FL=1